MSQGEDCVSVNKEDLNEKKPSKEIESKKQKKPKLAEDDSKDTKSTNSVETILDGTEQSKSGGQNEKLESATIEKQAPATNALESKELTESELHAEEMIQK